jgi:hypothetical protein
LARNLREFGRNDYFYSVFTEFPKMKKYSSLLILLLITAATTFGQYRKANVYELAVDADLILRGTITEVKGGNITLAVDGIVAGEYADASITVKRFKNYKLVKRWGKYMEKEELFLFLQQDGSDWNIMGLGGEGEKLIEAAEVYLDSRGEGVKNRFSYYDRLVEGNIYAEKVPLAEFEAAVEDIRDCIDLTWKEVVTKDGEAWKEPIVKFSCDDKALDAYRAQSWVHDEMLKTAEKAVAE